VWYHGVWASSGELAFSGMARRLRACAYMGRQVRAHSSYFATQ
jgi:hypothetical protein